MGGGGREGGKDRCLYLQPMPEQPRAFDLHRLVTEYAALKTEFCILHLSVKACSPNIKLVKYCFEVFALGHFQKCGAIILPCSCALRGTSTGKV